MKKTNYRSTVFYELYMPSFYDANGDGIGDFRGISAKLDYLKDLGIDGIWLTPFYQSPKIDNGYDISDYYTIDKDYGTMGEFQLFIKESHKRGIKVIADLVLNHTSSEHQWFKESRSSKNHPKRDWYIWKDPKDGGVPNNWESFFGGTAWEYDETTGQYYYHAFAKEQVDLNWANPEVKEAMFDVMKFWLEQGLDGFRLDVINFLKVQNEFHENLFDDKGEQIHGFDKDQEGIDAVIEEIAALAHSYNGTILVGEVGSDDLEVLTKYSGKKKLDVVFNFNLGSIESFDLDRIFKELQQMEAVHEKDQLPTLFFGSHDMGRFISRFGAKGDEEARAKVVAALMLTAKGIPFIYFGEEIGMKDIYIEDISLMKDIQGVTAYKIALDSGKTEEEALKIANEKGRDKSRSPMQWNETSNYGFTNGEPWISMPKVKVENTVSWQTSRKGTMLSFYKELLKIRKAEPALHSGHYEGLEKKDNVLFYIKSFEGERVLVLLNFDREGTRIDVREYIAHGAKLLFSNKRDDADWAETIELLPYEVMVIKLIGGNEDGINKQNENL